MALNRAFLGREYPAPTPYEVGREHIRRFAEAIGDLHPAYLDAAAARALGHPDVIAPPTFLTVLNFRFSAHGPVADPDLGLDYSRVVHGEQSFELHRPVVAGDVLSSVQRVEDIRDAGRNELLTTVLEVTGAGGDRVATLRSSLVSRGTAATARTGQVSSTQVSSGQASSGQLRSAQAGPVQPPTGSRSQLVVPARDQIEMGTVVPTRSFSLTRRDLVRYCGASGDFNVIHWNERMAKAVGLPDVIAHGMFTMAVAARVVTDWTSDPGALVSYRVRFSRPVVVPDDDAGAELVVAGVVDGELEDGTVVLGLTATVGQSKVLAGARAVVRLP